MKKNSGTQNKKSNTPQVDPFLEGMMGKLLDRFALLERKMDAVISAVASVKSSGGQDARGSYGAHNSHGSHGSQGSHGSHGSYQDQNLQAKERVARRERIMFEAICADCNAPCEVPFRPSEGRAIYCKECWAQRRAGGSGSGPHATLTLSAKSAVSPAKPAESAPAAAATAARGASPKAGKRPAAKKSKKGK